MLGAVARAVVMAEAGAASAAFAGLAAASRSMSLTYGATMPAAAGSMAFRMGVGQAKMAEGVVLEFSGGVTKQTFL